MIESCSKKRMLIAITCLGGLTLFILILESNWANEKDFSLHLHAYKNASAAETCWLKENYEVVETCHPCSAFEVASKSVPACVPTGYKEILLCKFSGKVFRACDKVTWIEEQKFWVFEGCMLIAALLSSGVAYTRQKILDHQMLQRIQRQLARGV